MFNSKKIRSLIKILINETQNLSNSIDSKNITYDCMIAIAEYVGANEHFEYEKYSSELEPFCRQWSHLYRLWPNLGYKSLDELETLVKSRRYFSSSKTLFAIKQILENGNISNTQNHMIVTFSGWGFDPIEYLQEGLKTIQLSKVHRKFILDVIYNNKHQEEVIVLHADKFKRVQIDR